MDENQEEESLDDLEDVEQELTSTLPKEICPAQILIRFFEFFGTDFDMEHKVISLRAKKVMTRQEKGWGARRIAIEDPFMRKRNICRQMTSQAAFDYMRTR